jgi:hypothetical protein
MTFLQENTRTVEDALVPADLVPSRKLKLTKEEESILDTEFQEISDESILCELSIHGTLVRYKGTLPALANGALESLGSES